MAQTEHLPIYKAAYDLCLYLEQVVHKFSRYHKYTLGADLRDSARRALRRWWGPTRGAIKRPCYLSSGKSLRS